MTYCALKLGWELRLLICIETCQSTKTSGINCIHFLNLDTSKLRTKTFDKNRANYKFNSIKVSDLTILEWSKKYELLRSYQSMIHRPTDIEVEFQHIWFVEDSKTKHWTGTEISVISFVEQILANDHERLWGFFNRFLHRQNHFWWQ